MTIYALTYLSLTCEISPSSVVGCVVVLHMWLQKVRATLSDGKKEREVQDRHLLVAALAPIRQERKTQGHD